VIRLRTGRDPLALARASGWGGVIGGLSLVAAYTGGIYAVQSTSVANAMMLFASAPLLAAVLGRVILREMVRPQTWVAIAVASGGIAIMVWDKSSGAALRGNLAALGSALGFAVFTITLRWGKNTEMMPSVFISGLFAIAIMGVICLWLGLPLVVSLPDTGIALGMGVFQVGAGLILYTIGSKTVPAAELTLLSLAEVVLGPVWVWLVLGETASINTLIGGAVLLTAIAGNALSGARRKPPVVIV
jgi:drug/metabolite transporter (DMT)-like permease